MNILITGANGQLGNEMRNASANHEKHHCHFTDVAELDICDPEAIEAFVSANHIDVIVNCAAYTAVDKAEDDAQLCEKLNHIAPCYLAESAQKHGAALIQISTDYVFDGTAHIPYTENDATCPNSVYGRTKVACERDIMQICSRTVVIRTAWLYSVYGGNFVKTMLRLGKEREALGVVFDQIGTPTYAADLADAIFCIIEKGIQPGIYHYSNEGVCSWYDFTLAIHRLAGIKTCAVRPLHTSEYPAKAPRPHFSVLDKTKIKQTYGISIPHWEQSLAVCIDKLLRQD